ncbi:MAG: DUF1194 domain-containing protein [bacterium]|nr:DUF1194 domain-containing protein [bacterium]
MRILSRLFAAIAVVFCLGLASEASAIAVDVELQLLVDVSGSVDSTEFDLQRTGYANAIRSQAVIDSILDTSGGRIGAIAVQFVYWSGAGQQKIIKNAGGQEWTLINSQMSANSFGNWIAIQPGTFFGQTAVGEAIDFGAAQFAGNGYEGVRKVIDVSGDGATNDGYGIEGPAASTSAARDAALGSGIDAINGLVILNEEPNVDLFYLANVIGGSGSFLEQVNSFADFEQAVQVKLVREITTPEPALSLLLGLSALLLVARGRRA